MSVFVTGRNWKAYRSPSNSETPKTRMVRSYLLSLWDGEVTSSVLGKGTRERERERERERLGKRWNDNIQDRIGLEDGGSVRAMKNRIGWTETYC